MPAPPPLSKIGEELEAGNNRHREFTRKLSRTCRFAIPSTAFFSPSTESDFEPSSRCYLTVFPNQGLFILQLPPRTESAA
jgi:hypothetical protein